MFSKNKKKRFVIEIGDAFLKIVCANNPEKVKFGYQEIGNLDSRDISDVIKNICRKEKINTFSGILCVPRNRITIGTLHLPSTDKNEIAQMVKVHATSQVPYPKEEIIVDWRVVMCDKEGYADVILVILQKTLISKCFGILSAAGIELKDVVVGPETALSWFLTENQDICDSKKTTIILNVDYDFTDFLLCSGNEIIASHLIAQGQKVLLTSKPSREVFIGEFKQAMGVVPPAFSEGRDKEIFICGADQSFVELEESLKTEFNCSVQQVKPKTSFSGEVSFISLLGAAYGKKKQKFSLDIPEIQIKKEWKSKLKRFVLLSGLLAYAIAMLFASFSTQIYKRKKYLEEIKLKCTHIKEESDKLGIFFRKIRLIDSIRNPKNSFLYYLSKVSGPIPEGCSLSEINFIKGEKIVIKGEALRMSDIFDFISQLETSGIFSDVETKYTRKVKGAKENKSEFEIACYIEPIGE